MPTVTVELPSLLAEHTGGQTRIALSGDTVEAVLRGLGAAHPALHPLLWRQGAFNPVLAVFVGAENIDALQGLATPLREGDTVTVISALEGG